MSKFAITRVKWNPEKTQIVLVTLHQFMEGRLNGVLYMLRLDKGITADVRNVIEMMKVGDTFEIANEVIDNRGLKGDPVRAKNAYELESFNEAGSTLQLEALPEILELMPDV